MARPAARSDIRSDPHPGADRLPPLEIELKLAVPKAAGQALRQRLEAYGSQPALPVDSVYFDTGDRRLASQRAALRVRRVDAPRPHWVQTFKTNDAPAALSQRGEWETQVQGPRLDRPSLSRSPLLQMLGDRPGRLAPVFRTRFERTVREVQYNGARIELALDEGEIVAGRRKEPIREIELELCDGASSALFGLALDLVGRGRDALALVPSIDSKAARGYRLAQHAGPHPISAGPDGFAGLLQPQLGSAEAARRVVAHGVYRVLANVQGAAAGEDPEYVHQARVALRRTRSALRVLATATAADDPIARDLRWMADCFGQVRDWDVRLAHSLPALRRAIGSSDRADDDAEWDRLLTRAKRRRHGQQERLRATLGSVRFARATLRLLQWAHQPTPGASITLAHLAPRAIERGHRRLIAAGRDLSGLSARGRHRLRILAKRQRYALELLAPVLPEGVAGRTLKLLSRLQQTLGEINDVHMAVLILPSLTRSPELLRRTQRWSARNLRHHVPKAAALVDRLERRGSGL
jgi:inorganic triphosphatase YgiF